MKRIEATIIADSKGMNGTRLTTMLLTFPRFILAELNTHRVFSKNSASSRAIPFNKMLKMVQEDPFIPIAWQSHHSGMQGEEYLTNARDISWARQYWIEASKSAVKEAKILDGHGITKQLCNRLLEPFMWHTVLCSFTEIENFYNLRCPKYKVTGLACGPQKSKKDWLKHMKFSSAVSSTPVTIEEWQSINESSAEIHMQALAEAMWDAMNKSEPKTLFPGEWHIPYGDQLEVPAIQSLMNKDTDVEDPRYWDVFNNFKIKIASARCARLSYMTQDGKIDYQKDIELHDRLLTSGHMSPFEHCARMMTLAEYTTFIRGFEVKDSTLANVLDKNHPRTDVYMNWNSNHMGIYNGWCNNFRGFIQYRHLIENK
jgi:hypothetical protein